MTTLIQPMPQLSDSELSSLRAQIAEQGVVVPITVDQHGRIIDGNNRAAIAAELGVDCPRRVVQVADDDAAHEMALTLNLARRHLSREQKRDLVVAELIRCPRDSDRAIARRLGCSPTTVGTVRADRQHEAEQRTERLHHSMRECASALNHACVEILLAGADPEVLIRKAASARDAVKPGAEHAMRTEGRESVVELISSYVYTCLVNDLTDIVNEVKASGVSFPLPLTMPAQRLAELVDAIYPLRLPDSVQVGHPSGAVVESSGL